MNHATSVVTLRSGHYSGGERKTSPADGARRPPDRWYHRSQEDVVPCLELRDPDSFRKGDDALPFLLKSIERL